MKIVDAFQKATGVTINVSNKSYDDIQPKASVAANTGQGLDMVWGLYSLPFLFPEKCTDMTDVADYLAKKCGGWANSGEAYGKLGNKWIGVPVAATGGSRQLSRQGGRKGRPQGIPEGPRRLCRSGQGH